MIFVTVGTHYLGFDRLIKKMDEIAPKLNDEIIMQIGYTDYEPVNTRWFKFMEYNGILNMYKKADIIVAHAGAGTLLDSLSFEKRVIVVPRLKEFNEHIDNQQLDLAEALEKLSRATAVYDIEELKKVIISVVSNISSESNNNKLANFLKDYLKGIEQ